MLRRRRARGGDRTTTIEDEHEALPERLGPDQELEQSELAAQVEGAIESIHPTRRPVVRMHLLGHSREEIANLLGWTEAKTRNLLYRGLADVREHLVAQGVRWTSQT
jgi:RNA polymerase sigma-70 factor (ECF subfamily)